MSRFPDPSYAETLWTISVHFEYYVMSLRDLLTMLIFMFYQAISHAMFSIQVPIHRGLIPMPNQFSESLQFSSVLLLCTSQWPVWDLSGGWCFSSLLKVFVCSRERCMHRFAMISKVHTELYGIIFLRFHPIMISLKSSCTRAPSIWFSDNTTRI